MTQTKYWTEKLDMQPHPEGGHYKETYRSSDEVEVAAMPEGFEGKRTWSTAIYYLLSKGEYSKFHRLKSDEIWHYHAGGTMEIYSIDPEGKLECKKLGLNLEKGERPQIVIPAGCWFAACPTADSDYVLCSCTVSPGFDFRDFEQANYADLSRVYPDHSEIIRTLS